MTLGLLNPLALYKENLKTTQHWTFEEQTWKDVNEILNSSTKDALMDDSAAPSYNLQLEPQDGHYLGDSVEGVTRLSSASDENENQLVGVGAEHLTSRDRAMGKTEGFEQDSLNNNESCPASLEVSASENLENTAGEGPKEGQAFVEEDKIVPGKRSARTKRGTARKTPPEDATFPAQEKTVSAATSATAEEAAAEGNAHGWPDTPKPGLQPLLSLIHGQLEQVDSRALPLWLHQVAESYFQEEDYEKAMKFIQLERLYHEQLLANLSAIQEQWETKWKSVQLHTVTPPRNSEKGLNGEDFEQLAKFCTTHQNPHLPKHKLAAEEKYLGRKLSTQLTVSEDTKKNGATAKESGSEACSGLQPSQEKQHEKASQESPGWNQMDTQADAQGLPVTTEKGHGEEPLCSQEASLERHTQPPETGSTSGPEAPRKAGASRGSLQAAHTEDHPEEARGEAVAAVPEEEPPSELLIKPLVFPGCDRAPPGLVSEGQYSQTHRQELHLPLEDASEALSRARLGNNALSELRESDRADSDGKSPQSQSDSEPGSEHTPCQNKKISDLSTQLPEVCMAPDERGDEDDQVNKETEDYLNSLLGCLKDTQDSISYEDNQDDDDSELLQDLSPEEASYTLPESLPTDESSLSLDDLAKRIEIAEVAPAEGLVSILKKRNDSVGEHPAQMQPRPSKRRVRFQEVGDHLDPGRPLSPGLAAPTISAGRKNKLLHGA
ncbi:consortin isoform X2 [Perognathus longimembris pacificus]|uniref:consortin isoform X2 n=1 Tax=Perognathus longimembris pacificus TaxID=214514 RepID=UPI002018DE51|nr:consortin isoform X2 [Perognathus longimembris pacificus]